MRFYFIPLAALVLITVCFGCRTSPHTLLDYVQQPAHGLSQEQHIQLNDFSIQYIPADLQILADKGPDVSAATLKQDRSKYDGYAYFRLTVQNEDFEPAGDTLSYLNFNMMNDLTLVLDKGDTIPCIFYQKIVNGNKHRHEFMVVFEEPAVKDQDFRFVYTDKVFGRQPVVFRFKAKDLKNIPQL